MNTRKYKQVIAISVAAVLASACDQLPFDMPGSAPSAPDTTDQAATPTPEAAPTPQDAAVEEVVAPLDPNRVCKAYEDGFQTITTQSIRDIEGCWLKRNDPNLEGYIKFENGMLHSIGHGNLGTGDFPYKYQDRCRDEVSSEDGKIARIGYACQHLERASNRNVYLEISEFRDAFPRHFISYTLVGREDSATLDAQVAARMNSASQ